MSSKSPSPSSGRCSHDGCSNSKLVQRSPILTFQAIHGLLCPHRSQTHLCLFLILSGVILVVLSWLHSTTLVFVYLLRCLGSMQMAPLRLLGLYCSLMVLNEPFVLMTRWNLEALGWKSAHLSGMKATPSHCSFAKLHLACFIVIRKTFQGHLQQNQSALCA